MDMNATTEEQSFLCGLCPGVIIRTVGTMSSVEFCTGGCEDIGPERVKLKNIYC
jgi:hypothetical protein